jgi:uncharacterized delta-60 repeat protein
MTSARFSLVAVIAVLAVLASALPAAAAPAPGSLDRSFGERGKLALRVPGANFQPAALDRLSDGSIVVAGYDGGDPARLGADVDLIVLRLTPRGVLDERFGNGGVARVNVADVKRISAVAVHPDGRVVVAGVSSVRFVFVRLTADGRLDPSFGTAGVVGYDDTPGRVEDMAVLPGDGLLAVGWIHTYFRGGQPVGMALRLTASGEVAPDPGSSTAMASRLTAVQLQPSGDAIVAGESDSENGTVQFLGSVPSSGPASALFLERGGRNTWSRAEGTADMALLPRGGAVIAGSNGDLVLSVLNRRFRRTATRRTDVPQMADFLHRSVAVGVDQRGGIVQVATIGDWYSTGVSRLGLVRYRPGDLRLDRGFGRRGGVVTRFARPAFALDALTQPNGRTLVLGSSGPHRPWATVTYLARYHGRR